MINGYNQIYLGLLPKLSECDFKEIAERLGFKYISSGKIAIDFLGRGYIITPDGVTAADGEPTNVNFRNVILYYVLSAGSGEPKYSFVPLHRLTGMIAGSHAITDKIMNAPLIREFDNNIERLKSSVSVLGGVYEGMIRGSHSWLINVLPKIPVKFIFYETDEEFPADIQIMLDETAPSFMDFECLAFLCGCLVSALTGKK